MLKIRNFRTPFSKDKSVGLRNKNGLKFAFVVELAKLNFTHSTKIAKAKPGFDDSRTAKEHLCSCP